MPTAIKPPRKSHLPVDLPAIGFVRLPQILRVFPVARTTFLDGVKQGLYPKPVKIGVKATAWKVEDIRALIAKLGEGE